MNFSFSGLVYADVVFPTVTNVYFEKDGKPYNKPVSFTVNCYGYTWPAGPKIEKKPGTYTLEKVFSFSATCPAYGCKIYENYYLNYRHIDYCDLEGQTAGKQFQIEKYTTNPVLNCSNRNSPGFENEKDDKGNALERKCELRITIPSESNNGQPSTTLNPQPQPNKGFFISTIESIMCFFKKLFGKSC